MADNKILLRYAESLLGVAVEKKNLETISEDMKLISSVVHSNRQLGLMVESPVIKPQLKDSILNNIFSGKVNDDSLKFISFLIEKNRIEFLDGIIQKFFELHDEYLGIVNVTIKAAQEFSKEQSDRIQTKFEQVLNKKVRLNFEIDSSIIGGFVAKAGDTVFDASIRNKLQVLKKQFAAGGI